MSNKNRDLPPQGNCRACGKKCFRTRKLAAAAIHHHLRVLADVGRLTADETREAYETYKCKSGNGWWHFGHVLGHNREHDRPTRAVPENRRINVRYADPIQ